MANDIPGLVIFGDVIPRSQSRSFSLPPLKADPSGCAGADKPGSIITTLIFLELARLTHPGPVSRVAKHAQLGADRSYVC